MNLPPGYNDDGIEKYSRLRFLIYRAVGLESPDLFPALSYTLAAASAVVTVKSCQHSHSSLGPW